ncbi:hypothetical protein [Rhodococcus sp. NPDC060176]|uniref:hypothetical protein n=1 Tax=Rhodococcus sp. NPDC060176 TaxID=3347062 RepID=UPI00365255A9
MCSVGQLTLPFDHQGNTGGVRFGRGVREQKRIRDHKSIRFCCKNCHSGPLQGSVDLVKALLCGLCQRFESIDNLAGSLPVCGGPVLSRFRGLPFPVSTVHGGNTAEIP